MAAFPARVEAKTSDYCRNHQMAAGPAAAPEKTRNRRAEDQMAKAHHQAAETGTEYFAVAGQGTVGSPPVGRQTVGLRIAGSPPAARPLGDLPPVGPRPAARVAVAGRFARGSR